MAGTTISCGRSHLSSLCSTAQTAVLAFRRVGRLFSEKCSQVCLSAGRTSVLATVYGPVQPKMARRELVDRCAVEVVFKPYNGIAGAGS